MSQKLILSLLAIVFYANCFSQNITVDTQSFTPQELVEDILIGMGCVENVQVTNAVSGNFGTMDSSFGYFNGNNSSFPFEEGIVLSSGRVSNVPGPNDDLSDDDAGGWTGDTDLENALMISNTINATVIEFDFTPQENLINFRYIFASEEYREGDPNTCRFSDAFAFLIREQGTTAYDNIAVVPGTNTPVLVTTVRPDIIDNNGNVRCMAENEEFFGQFNGTNAPINFNGQTAILTAETNVTPNVNYHIKLVLADEGNARFDSAVFLEARSFGSNTDLGDDRLIADGTANCPDDITILQALEAPISETYTYMWYRNDILQAETSSTFQVSQAGTYRVEVILTSGCMIEDEIVIEYFADDVVNDATLEECDNNSDGSENFDLTDAETQILAGATGYTIQGYFETETGAETNDTSVQIMAITAYSSTGSTVFARTRSASGCIDISEITLTVTPSTPINPELLEACGTNGFGTFNLNDASALFDMQTAAGTNYHYYRNTTDAENGTDEITSATYQNEVQDVQTLVVVIENATTCYENTTLELVVNSTVNLNLTDTTLSGCDTDEDGMLIFNLFDAEATILQNEPNATLVNFYNSQADAEMDNSPIPNPTAYDTVTPNEVVFARVESQSGCADVAEVTLEFSMVETLMPEQLESCGDNILATFDPSEAAMLFDMQAMANTSYRFYRNQSDANNNVNEVTLTELPTTTLIVVVDNPDTCYANTTFDFLVTETPDLPADETVDFCSTDSSSTMTLSADVTNDNGSFMYLWSTGETTERIEISSRGQYSVEVTNTANGISCSNTRTFDVQSNFISELNVQINDEFPSFTVTLFATGSGDLQYSIDNPNGPFQDSNVFTNVSPGLHTAYARNGDCGLILKEFAVLDFPRFFTPNGDGFNDRWNILNSTGDNNGINVIYIFDRYGKLLQTLSPLSQGWDGLYNGRKLPSSEYWFMAEFQSGFVFKSHFTLKR